jgi:hypothetical protein
MDEEHSKKLINSLISNYISRNSPKPSVDISLCKTCNKMTDKWFCAWPKSREIIWKCKECSEKEGKERMKDLEKRLEKMCLEH